MIRDFANSAILKKNTIMFLTSAAFITGIAAYFNNCEIIAGAILTFVLSILVWRNKISYKFIILWIFVFYLGFFNAKNIPMNFP